MAAYGLYTHIASNKFRSMLLLAGLFLLIYVLVYAGALVAEVVINSGASADYYLAAAGRDLVGFFARSGRQRIAGKAKRGGHGVLAQSSNSVGQSPSCTLDSSPSAVQRRPSEKLISKTGSPSSSISSMGGSFSRRSTWWSLCFMVALFSEWNFVTPNLDCAYRPHHRETPTAPVGRL